MHKKTIGILQKMIAAILFFFIAALGIFAQEALKSVEEEYYDFLSLSGIVERPTLGYRTLSDSQWNFIEYREMSIDEDGNTTEQTTSTRNSSQNIWQKNNLGKKYFINGNTRLAWKLFGPDLYMSYNTAAPYGQNDGALWQGKGFNASFTTGGRFEAYGVEITIKPQVSFSQNAEFATISPNSAYSDTKYVGKAALYGYYGVASVDAPQRFGDSSFFTFDWGDSEIRYTWKTLTIGFGTQSLWLGPAKLNPIISSNNAASYPKFDIGVRRQHIVIPKLGWYLGDIELRGWWGCLSESDYFDNDNTNDFNLISGFALYYQFPFLKHLTIGFNRTMISKWTNMNAYTLFGIYVPWDSQKGGVDESDQRFSFTIDYIMPKAGFEIYFEWARNDHSPNLNYYFRYPFHTQGWTLGAEKSIIFSRELKGKLSLEVTFLECSADYDRLINWYSTFYAHHQILQGYTNRGQWLGAGIGTGGNSQYVGFTLYHKNGNASIFFQRRNPDLDYTMFIDSRKYSENYKKGIFTAEGNIRALFDIGISAVYYPIKNLQLYATFVFEDEHNPLYESKNGLSAHRINCALSTRVKYNF